MTHESTHKHSNNLIHSHERHHKFDLSSLLDIHGTKDASRIRRAVTIGCAVNLFLLLLKLSFGYWGHSEALVADGFHSFGDVGTDIVMLTFVGLSFRIPSKRYNYGYGKFETFASLIISGILLFIAIMLVMEALDSIKEYAAGATLERPDIWTLIAILFAIVCKEFLYRFYRHVGKSTRCNALISSAWHHRSDAFSSIATVIGVSFAFFLGENWRILDPCASLVIVIFIIIPAIRLFLPAFQELMEKSIPTEDRENAARLISEIPDVKNLEYLKSRKSGPYLIFDIGIKLDPKMTIEEGSVISSEIEHKLIHEFGKNIRISVVFR